jgi:hypothetical protein
MAAPFCGFRPARAARFPCENVPKPTSVTFSPFLSEPVMVSIIASTMLSAIALLPPAFLAMASTSSALFIFFPLLSNERLRRDTSATFLKTKIFRRGRRSIALRGYISPGTPATTLSLLLQKHYPLVLIAHNDVIVETLITGGPRRLLMNISKEHPVIRGNRRLSVSATHQSYPARRSLRGKAARNGAM